MTNESKTNTFKDTEFNYRQRPKDKNYNKNYEKAFRKKCTWCSKLLYENEQSVYADEIYCEDCLNELTDGLAKGLCDASM